MCASEEQVVHFSVPPENQVLDLHGDPAHHDLALFMHGNQWMAVDGLLQGFRAAVPEVREVYYETLPPGILVRQMRLGVLQMGSLVIRVAPDVLAAGYEALQSLADEGLVEGYREYASNTLAILVRRGNPLSVTGWADLARPGVRVALPDPETEGIGRLIREAVVDAAGSTAWAAMTGRKREQGTTLCTRIHHRETPLYLQEDRVDAGPVWLTEALHQERLGAPVEIVRLPADQNRRGRYGIAQVGPASPHPVAARAFVEFLCGPAGQAILRAYGFEGPAGRQETVSGMG